MFTGQNVEVKNYLHVCMATNFTDVLFSFSSESNASKSNYVRHVFSMVPGILALAGSLVVLFFQTSMLRSTIRGW